jgi:hypothetical protein
MIEATHLIKPFATSVPRIYNRSFEGSGYIFVESTNPAEIVGRTSFCDNEQEAVSQWNAMFSKAPFVAHMGEV